MLLLVTPVKLLLYVFASCFLRQLTTHYGQVRDSGNVKCLDATRSILLPNEFVIFFCCSLLLCCLKKSAWQTRKDFVNLSCRRRAYESFRGTVRGSGASVCASIPLGPSRDFLYTLIRSAASRIPKPRANINPPRCIYSQASVHFARYSNELVTPALAKSDVRL